MQRNRLKSRSLGAIFSAAIVCQLGGCEFGQISTSVTLDGRALIVSLVRGAVLDPLDALITGAVDNLFSDNQ